MLMPDSMLADVILATSPVTRLGLAAPNAHVRQHAAIELAQVILARIDDAPSGTGGDQPQLPL